RRPLRYPPDASAHVDRSLARLERAGEQREQRRLSCAVGPDERNGLSGDELEICRRERDDVAVAARDACGADHGAAGAAGLSTLSGTTSSSTSVPGSSTDQRCSSSRSAKNSHTARPAASSGSATRIPGKP